MNSAHSLNYSTALIPKDNKSRRIPEFEGRLYDKTPEKAADDNVVTCADTSVANLSWWEVEFSEKAVIHTVVLQTGIGFGCK